MMRAVFIAAAAEFVAIAMFIGMAFLWMIIAGTA